MIRKREPLSVLIAILVAITAFAGFIVFVVIGRLQTLQTQLAADTIPSVDTSSWQVYQNDQYQFQLKYPPQWKISTAGLAGDTPFVAFGNPLTGPKTYDVQVFIENNPNSLSSGEYAHTILAAARAADAENSKNGPAPQMAPQYEKSYLLTAGAYPAYEFYKVFEFDHNAERIYITHGNIALRFDFPIREENPNLSLPLANNDVAHEIIDTLVFTD